MSPKLAVCTRPVYLVALTRTRRRWELTARFWRSVQGGVYVCMQRQIGVVEEYFEGAGRDYVLHSANCDDGGLTRFGISTTSGCPFQFRHYSPKKVIREGTLGLTQLES